jgi:hypothetical protein
VLLRDRWDCARYVVVDWYRSRPAVDTPRDRLKLRDEVENGPIQPITLRTVIETFTNNGKLKMTNKTQVMHTSVSGSRGCAKLIVQIITKR